MVVVGTPGVMLKIEMLHGGGRHSWGDVEKEMLHGGGRHSWGDVKI